MGRISRIIARPCDADVDGDSRWLSNCLRLLNIAEDSSCPLQQRVEAVRACSRRLDHFFSVGVALLHDRAFGLTEAPRSDCSHTVSKLREIRRSVRSAVARQYRCWNECLVPALADRSIRLRAYGDVTRREAHVLARFFQEAVFPILTPMAIDSSHPKPAFRSRSLYLGALLRRRVVRGPDRLFGVVQIPAQIPRLVPFQGEQGPRFALLEEVIGANLTRLFGGYQLIGWTTFRFTRGSCLRQLWRGEGAGGAHIRTRIMGWRPNHVARLEIARGVSPQLMRCLVKVERLSLPPLNEDEYSGVYVVSGPVDLGGLARMVNLASALGRPFKGEAAHAMPKTA